MRICCNSELLPSRIRWLPLLLWGRGGRSPINCRATPVTARWRTHLQRDKPQHLESVLVKKLNRVLFEGDIVGVARLVVFPNRLGIARVQPINAHSSSANSFGCVKIFA